jgi:hypothetical protein
MIFAILLAHGKSCPAQNRAHTILSAVGRRHHSHPSELCIELRINLSDRLSCDGESRFIGHDDAIHSECLLRSE